MALRWLLTEFLTGKITQEVTVADPSLTLGLTDGSPGTASIVIGHFIRANESLDLIRAKDLHNKITPGRSCLTAIDMEEDEAWGGGADRVIGEWMIRSATPATDSGQISLELGGILDYAGDNLFASDYSGTGAPSWIISDLLTAAFAGVQIAIPKPTIGGTTTGTWSAGKQTYADAIGSVQQVSGMEIACRWTLELENGAPSRVVRSVEFGAPISNLNVYRVIDASSNGISVSRTSSIDLWASRVRAFGAGAGADQWAGSASRAVPAGMPPVSRILTDPNLKSTSAANAAAATKLAHLSGVDSLRVTAVRQNWTNKFPSLGSRHRVVVDPCLAFPDGIDAQYRITTIRYAPTDTSPDTVQLEMEPA